MEVIGVVQVNRAWLFAILFLCPPPTEADPIARFAASNIVVTLHDADCQLKAEIKNLPRRAVWLENGKEVEGCCGASSQFGFVALYFADKTATAIPMQAFERITGA